MLLFTLIAVAFFGFLLWSIWQIQTEEEAAMTAGATANSPLKNNYIEVTSVKAGQSVKSPLTVAGNVLLKTGVLRARIKDASNLVLAETIIKSSVSQKSAPFSAKITYKKPTRSKGTLEVFEKNNGTELYKLTIPIVFKD